MAKTNMINREIKRARTVKKYAAKRAQLKAAISSPKSSDEQRAEAMAKLQPRIFFKHEPIFRQQLQQWNLVALTKVLRALNELESECKKTGNPAELLCARFFTILPFAARVKA